MRVNGQVGRCGLIVSLLTGTLASASFATWCSQAAAADGPARIARRAAETGADGWTAAAPRDEIRPEFAYDPKGGADGTGSLTIKADGREGLDGWWTKAFSITGGKHYRFEASFQAKGVAVSRRSIVVELHWRDARGRKVPLDRQPVTGYLR